MNFFSSSHRSGQMTLQILILATVATLLIAGFALWADVGIKAAYRTFNKATAFAAAEAGIEYYRWHLAHAPTDYWDGQGASSTSPYVHAYYDKSGDQLGQFSLEVTPPALGSTIVTIKSTGKSDADSTIQKIIRVKLAKASFAKYAWALNDFVNFGTGAEIFGQIHSNTGIHFDGVAHNLITSAIYSYDDPDHNEPGADPLEFAVHTHVAPVDSLPTSSVPNRPDIFMAGRQFPVAPIDFNGITQDLSQIKTDAQAAGFYRPSSTAQGYEIQFKTNDTFDLWRVTSIMNAPSGCSNTSTGWSTWTVQNRVSLGNFAFPANGLMFFEDNLWVKGQINTARLTIAAGRFPDNPLTRSNIIANSPVLYTNYDGQDVLSFIAQNNFTIGLVASDTLRVDAAVIAQNGRVGRYSYEDTQCGTTRSRTSFTSYGMLGTNLRPAFFYSASNGFQSRTYIYDSFLLYSPPPNFPLTTDSYIQLSWEEIQ